MSSTPSETNPIPGDRVDADPAGEAMAPKRYLSSAGWQHIFMGTRAETTRWVFDTQADHFVLAQVEAVRGWTNIRDRWMLDDLRADLADNGVLHSGSDRAELDVVESDEWPTWAQGTQQAPAAERATEDDARRSSPRQRGG